MDQSAITAAQNEISTNKTTKRETIKNTRKTFVVFIVS